MSVLGGEADIRQFGPSSGFDPKAEMQSGETAAESVTGFISSFDPKRSSPVLGSKMKHLGSMSFRGIARTVTDAVALARHSKPDLVILDKLFRAGGPSRPAGWSGNRLRCIGAPHVPSQSACSPARFASEGYADRTFWAVTLPGLARNRRGGPGRRCPVLRVERK
jgi:hypothetical protein